MTVPSGDRVCSDCERSFPRSAFPRTGLYTYVCDDCRKARRKAASAKWAEKRRKMAPPPLTYVEVKWCHTCTKTLWLGEFYRNSLGYVTPECRSCTSARSAKWARSHPEQAREKGRRHYAKPENKDRHDDRSIQWRHGITRAVYNAKLEQQQGVCAVCGEPETREVKGKLSRLNVDHDHTCCPGFRSCGKCIRDLLCNRCNRTLGMAGDDLKLLLNLAEYLERWGKS